MSEFLGPSAAATRKVTAASWSWCGGVISTLQVHKSVLLCVRFAQDLATQRHRAEAEKGGNIDAAQENGARDNGSTCLDLQVHRVRVVLTSRPMASPQAQQVLLVRLLALAAETAQMQIPVRHVAEDASRARRAQAMDPRDPQGEEAALIDFRDSGGPICARVEQLHLPVVKVRARVVLPRVARLRGLSGDDHAGLNSRGTVRTTRATAENAKL